MATTIKSSALDFDTIKANLKNYFAQQSEFSDYDFEASGLNNILDVLAYNTHINGLTANLALNEALLNIKAKHLSGGQKKKLVIYQFMKII